MKRDKRKHKYLVGYSGENQVAYDMRHKELSRHYVEPLTLFQAKRAVKELGSLNVDRVIYELVPFEVIKPKNQK